MAYSPRACPISWSSARYGHCLGHVKPSTETGMFVNLRKNLSPTLQDPRNKHKKAAGEGVRNENSAKYYAYIKLLQRQRQAQKTYTGELFPRNPNAHAEVARNVGDRLHKMVNVYQPAEAHHGPAIRYHGDDFSLKKPVYTRDEALRILNKMAAYKADSAQPEGEKRMDDVRKRFRKSQLYYPATSVREAIWEYLGGKNCSAESIHRPLSARSRAHSPIFKEIARDVKDSERKHPPDDVMETTQRLHDEAVYCRVRRRRRAQSAPLERTRSRKVTEEELQEIIDRLAKYDDTKWPPESRDPKQLNIYK
ncbi:hypothetical protein LSH36_235g02023 [Paralvinella palmiformis]|uniref:Uncharacterized protein n=1 Tax=Paralvinella palmiformis TaxID=53620 RepID=A0AAD9N3C3_9ANNE|nr:hypothetical protein LSH36_235g02023 [Paralvinella palmiformis]